MHDDDYYADLALSVSRWVIGATVILWLSLALAIVLMFPSDAAAQPVEAAKYQRDLTRQARQVWGLNAPVATFAAQIQQESGWRRDAVPPVGASGMAQFMPATASWLCGKYSDLPPGCDAMNPAWAMRALLTYDKYLFDRMAWAGDECGRMWMALRSYNGGEGHLVKEARLAADPTDRGQVDAKCGQASRSARHCLENTGYPKRIIERHQPKFASWGRGVCS